MTSVAAGMRVGIVGCGRMGAERASRAVALGASVVACADTDPKRSQALATLYRGAVAGTSANDIPWRDLDAVFICTPPSVRGEAVNQAVDAGVAVMVEKPIGLSAAQGSQLECAVRSAGVVNAVGYMNRYRASVRLAKTLIAGKSVAVIMCHWACRPYGVAWWRTEDESGGPFNEQATHLVDLCRFVGGEIDAVEAYAGNKNGATGAPTRVAAALRFHNGAVGTLCYTCDAPDKFIAFEAVTTAGMVRLEGWDFALTANTIDSARCTEDANVFETETGAFLNAAATKDQTLIASSFEDALRTQVLVDAVCAAVSR